LIKEWNGLHLRNNDDDRLLFVLPETSSTSNVFDGSISYILDPGIVILVDIEHEESEG